MSKNFEVSVLLDLYGKLLTEKQYDMLDFYYNDDFSLAEIAEHYDISRQGVHDSIKRGEELLLNYEKVLKLSENQKKYQDILVEFKSQALEILNECRKVSFGKNIADKTIVLLENLDSKLAEFDNSELLGE
ncbi:MAG: putative DNA-binding protein [Ruminococcus sp.]|nr:putative DNA-binding protein [Ruminococcus sp.]